jgi:hypothetical protein
VSITLVDAKKVLSDVPEHYMSFWFNNGIMAKNIYDFLRAVESCTKEVFQYHVNHEKNDFSRWVYDVLGDDVLSKRLTGEFDQKKVVFKIKKRIKELEKLK